MIRRGNILFAVRYTLSGGRVRWKHGFRKLQDAIEFRQSSGAQTWEYLELHGGEYLPIRDNIVSH